jgi:oligoribonuclease
MSQATDIQANTPPARPNEMNLIWVDMEMTGLTLIMTALSKWLW